MMQDVYMDRRADGMLRISSPDPVWVVDFMPLNEEGPGVTPDPEDPRAVLVPPGAFVLRTLTSQWIWGWTGKVLCDLETGKWYGVLN